VVAVRFDVNEPNTIEGNARWEEEAKGTVWRYRYRSDEEWKFTTKDPSTWEVKQHPYKDGSVPRLEFHRVVKKKGAAVNKRKSADDGVIDRFDGIGKKKARTRPRLVKAADVEPSIPSRSRPKIMKARPFTVEAKPVKFNPAKPDDFTAGLEPEGRWFE
jgi:hypothetical protein